MQKLIFKQMIEFNKTAFDKSFSMISALEEQAEKTLNLYMDRAAGFPEEGKKAINEWIDVYSKGSRDFQIAVRESFKKMDGIFEISGK
jgi:t-SNARE complex subunit (syntaxin)